MNVLEFLVKNLKLRADFHKSRLVEEHHCLPTVYSIRHFAVIVHVSLHKKNIPYFIIIPKRYIKFYKFTDNSTIERHLKGLSFKESVI